MITPGRTRRSPRLLTGASTEGHNGPPRKRRKSKHPRHHEPAATTLLSLPPELLSHIMHHLGVTKTAGTFRGPRHAFALAQTNTKFLHLFRTMMTRITPNVANMKPPTIAHDHMLAVARLAGTVLREIHLPRGAYKILPQLCNACPNVEVLSMVDNHDEYSCLAKQALRLPLRSLAIDDPSLDSVTCLKHPPPHLKLTNVMDTECNQLMTHMRQPPKSLHVEVHIVADIAEIEGPFLTSVSAMCPQMEALSLSIPSDDESDSENEVFTDKAEQLITATRRNRNSSLCKSMKLRGSQAFQLLKHAHPDAAIELCSGESTFGDDGNGLYALKLPVHGNPPAVDLSRLAEVSIAGCGIFDTDWKDVLKSARLKRVNVEHIPQKEHLDVEADLVVVSFRSLWPFTDNIAAWKLKNWEWLPRGVRELRIIHTRHLISWGKVADFLKTLAYLLDTFRGDVVWIEALQRLHAKDEKDGARRVRPAFRAARIALDRFEERGGDAGTVRVLLDSMVWTGTPERRCVCGRRH